MRVVQSLIKTLSPRPFCLNFRAICSCTVHYQKMEDIKDDMRNVFSYSVKAVNPNDLVRSAMSVNENVLNVRGATYVLNNNCFVVGYGKAVLGMATEAERILGRHLVAGVVSVPRGILQTLEGKADMLPGPGSVLKLREGAADNLPDRHSERAAAEIEELVRSAGEGSVVLVLASGGGSALLPLPRPPLTLGEKCLAVKLLASAGADIAELNCVRKGLSLLKGGGLARAARPARVAALVLSDVVGDPLDVIASGPTVVNSDPPGAAMNIIRKYSLSDKVPASVMYCLSENLKEPCTSDNFDHVQNVVIGNNTIAVESARREALSCGYYPVILSTRIQGLVKNVGKMYTDLAGEICKCVSGDGDNLSQLVSSFASRYEFFKTVENEIVCGVGKVISGQGLCLIAGGETTVVVQGRGLGGRNQELALQFATYMHSLEGLYPCISKFEVALLSCGTDGIDGPTSAAGAIGYSAQCSDDNLKPSCFLSNNDSHNFYRCFREGSDLVTIGHTGTNVMDIHILIVKKK